VSRNKDVYGDQRLKRLLAAQDSTISAAELNQVIVSDLHDFALGEDAADDITTVVIKTV